MKDTKLKLKALGVWWVICFVPILLLGSLLISFFTNAEITGTAIIIICVILATVVDLLLYYVIFPKVLNMPNEYQALLKEISENGFTEELKNRITEKYNTCIAKKDIYGGLFNEYALLLAGYYSDCKDYKKAYEYIDSIDDKALTKNLNHISAKFDLIKYCCVKLQIECYAKDKVRAKNTYNLANQAFVQFGNETNQQNMILVALSAYDVLRGKEELAIKKLQPILDDNDGMSLAKFCHIAEAYQGLGDYNKATRYYKEALRFAKNDFEKNSIFEELKSIEQ